MELFVTMSTFHRMSIITCNTHACFGPRMLSRTSPAGAEVQRLLGVLLCEEKLLLFVGRGHEPDEPSCLALAIQTLFYPEMHPWAKVSVTVFSRSAP
jgi:hypothetical protein